MTRRSWMTPSLKARQAGWAAKKNGDSFEEQIERRCIEQGIEFIDIPNGCKRIGRRPQDLIQVKSPFDCILGFAEKLVCLDLKTNATRSFKASMISPHQLTALKSAHLHGWAGYLVHFRGIDKIVFFDADVLAAARAETSLKSEDGIVVGDSLVCDLRSFIAKL